jgi:outer membrane protein TolC
VTAKVAVGTAAEEERVQSESGLAQRTIALIQAQRALELQDRILKDLIVRDLIAAKVLLEPVDEELLEPTVPPYDDVLEEALSFRPELDRARTLIAGAADSLNQTRNQALAQLDLEASIGVNGLGGSFGDSLENGREGDNNAWSIGVVYTKPWPDRASRGAVRRQESTLRQRELEAEREQRRIILEVGEIYDRLRSSADQIEAGEAAVKYAEKVLENEKVRFDVQKSTVYDLLLRETDLLEASLSLYQAMAEFRKNRASLYRVRGALLDRWDIELVPDTPTAHYPVPDTRHPIDGDPTP